MKFLAAILITFCIVLSLCSLKVFAEGGSKPAKTGGLELRVMSFNIRNGTANDGENRWKNRRQMVFELLRNQKCDVVGLQEALKFQIHEIMEEVPEFRMVGVGRDDGKTKGEYAAILYNRQRFKIDESGTFWLSDTPEVPGSITWGNACTRICTWARIVEIKTGRAFYMYNLHLDHVSQPSREKGVALVAERIRQRTYQEPFILTGDFNAGEDNPAILYLKGKAALDNGKGSQSQNPLSLVDTFRVLHPVANEVGTFHNFKGLRSGDKIDYIFTTPDVKVLETAILHNNTEGRYPSDHFPVIAEILISMNGRKSSM